MPAVATVAGLPNRLGKYELLLPLAAGGMARIYIGRSTGIGSFERHVVLKLITPERANDHTAVQMFLDEARLAASLNHQNVAQVFEVGEDSNIHYLAMEYVHGQDLRALLAKAGSQGTRIPLELALTVVAGAAAGLNHAHERRSADGTPMGIVHRDVSPSNIMIGYDGAVKLLDFGIAKATARSVETQSGIIKGKFAYMAPEQCRGRDVDRRSDVFSLGIILYEISTQHRCFRADSDFDTMHRIVTGDVVRPTRLVQGYPQALEAIVMKALAVDPAQRYQSAGLLLEAIESFAVSARMSLSTMGLGRFMRDMFGEVQEPWLGSAGKQPIAPKESTISSTDGRSDVVPSPRAPSHLPADDDGVPDENAHFPDSGSAPAAQTLLDLPRGKNEQPEDHRLEWNAKSYPSTPPSMASDQTLPPDAMSPLPPKTPPRGISAQQKTVTPPRGISSQQQAVTPARGLPTQRVTPARGLPAQPGVLATPPGQPVSRPTPPKAAFAQTPPSQSGPALQVPQPPIVSTRHGYASGGAMTGAGLPAGGANDLSYPGYSAPPGDELDVQLRPSRRALFIGIGIVLAGVIALVVHLTGGSKVKDEPIVTPPPAGSDTTGSGSATETHAVTPPVETPTPPTKDKVDDELVAIHIVSDPKGAEVRIAGSKVGITPYDGKLKRGTSVVELVIHLDGYTDYTAKLDLAGEYSNDRIKLTKIVEQPAEPDKTDNKTETTKTPDDKGKNPPRGTNPVRTNPTRNTTTNRTTTTRHTEPTHTDHTEPTHTEPAHPEPKCQPAGSVNPFDTSCDGKACPPCK